MVVHIGLSWLLLLCAVWFVLGMLAALDLTRPTGRWR